MLTGKFIERFVDGWTDEINNICRITRSKYPRLSFPLHFLKEPLYEIGGKVMYCLFNDQIIGVGYLFPKSINKTTNTYLLRYYQLDLNLPVSDGQIIQILKDYISDSNFLIYKPSASHQFFQTRLEKKGFSIGRPSYNESLQVPLLQELIWGSDSNSLYPYDIHCIEFGLATSIVARYDNEMMGFLFGFYKFDGAPLPKQLQQKYSGIMRIESQLMGVRPSNRAHGIGFELKKTQASQAIIEGISVINWTFDPLQFGNAKLNLTKLGGLIFDFHSNYYDFHNELNKVPSSRVSLTWLIRSPRVIQAMSPNSDSEIMDLRKEKGIVSVNTGTEEVDLECTASRIAIEIPEDWTDLQKRELNVAARWREYTDRIFQRYIGIEIGKYVITNVGILGSRRFLIADKLTSELLDQIGC